MKESKLWVVEAKLDFGWDPCNFVGMPYTSSSYHTIHKMKKSIEDELTKKSPEIWKKKNFRVAEWKRKGVKRSLI